jgi:hypothetical protein
VSERDLRDRLRSDPVPDEIEAGRRVWEVVRAAYGPRDRAPWIERHRRPALALAAAAALAVAAVSPPGRALVDRLRDEVTDETPSQPALFRLPAEGRLLVQSAQGPWVVQEDGSKRWLGTYQAASWSPRGLYVVAARGHIVVALDPKKTDETRWTVTRPGRVADARWAPSGFRIAYREERSLRVVVGDGTNDHLFARDVEPVAPAWFPDTTHNVLAYVDGAGRIRVVDVDTGAERWSASGSGSIAQLDWSADGSRLVAVAKDGGARLYGRRGRGAGRLSHVTGAAYSPLADTLAYTTYDPAGDGSSVVLSDGGRSRVLFSGSGRFQDLVWSPNGRWLLVTWPAADQWLFFRTPTLRGPVSTPGIRREFDPGDTGPGTFPSVSGWAQPTG